MGPKVTIYLVFLIVGFVQVSEPKIVPIVDKKYEDCTKGESAGILDIKNLQFVVKNDQYFLNGEFDS